MKAAKAKNTIRVAVIESARLPFSELNFQIGKETIELVPCTLAELGSRKDISLVLLSTSLSADLFSLLVNLRMEYPYLRVMVSGCEMNDETILKFAATGVKGFVDATSSAKEFARAMRAVHRSFVWMPNVCFPFLSGGQKDASKAAQP